MALASTLAAQAQRDSGLGRLLKGACGLAATFVLSFSLAACAGMGNGPDSREAGGAPGSETAGPDGRMPRPDVNPMGAEGAAAYGSPRSPGGGSGPLKVALLVPQTGKGKDLGNPLMDAAQMALFDTGRSDITLIVKNTSNGASNAAQSAINEGAQIIIGPVYSNEVASVRAVAAPLGVPVFTFSSDASAAGGGAYLMSFPLEEEVRTIVNYAASRGMGLFATMSPGDVYGRRATAAFERDVSAIGGKIIASATYGGDKATMYPSVMALDGKDFDALFIPGGGSGLRDISSLVRFGPPQPAPPKPLTEEQIAAGVAPPPPPQQLPRATLPEHILLGTGIWDEAANGNAGGLTRGIFAAPEPSTRVSFSNRFEGIYGYRPPRIASLGYDAMSLAATLGGAGQSAITDPNGFSGVDGIFRFLPNGQIQRGLAIIEVTGGGFGVVRGAPRSFQNPGS